MKTCPVFLLVSLFVLSNANADPKDELAKHYQNDPITSAQIRESIKKGLVINGMCPLQAFAAAGFPGAYMVKRDQEKWTSDVAPPDIVNAQCESPDNSVIELIFTNKTQFQNVKPVKFRVRFIKGKAVLIDQKEFGAD